MNYKRNNNLFKISQISFSSKYILILPLLIILNIWCYRILLNIHKVEDEGVTTFSSAKMNNATTPAPPCLLRDLKTLEAMGSRDANIMLRPPIQVLLSPNKTEFKPLMVIIITSMTESVLQRQEVRRTWMQWTKRYRVQALFFLGINPDLPNFKDIYADLIAEQEVHRDLIVINFQEGYYRLTAKTLRMIEWFLHFYPDNNRPKFLVKTDHDVFINIPNLLRHMYSAATWLSIRKNEYYFGGHMMKKVGVNLNSTTKWFLSPDYWYPDLKYYPHFLSGPFYIMSSNILEKLFNGSFNLPLFPFEDVYITGMLRRQLELKLTHIENLQLLSVPNMDKLKDMIAGHSVFSLTSFEQYWIHFGH